VNDTPDLGRSRVKRVATGKSDGDSPAELLELARTLAMMGGTLLADRFHHGREQALASKSSPTDVVTQADMDAERMIREMLESKRPQDGFMGEEGGERQGSSGLLWVVDPLDGTVNFLFGVPHWCVSVAVQDEDGALAGAIYDPIRKETFTASRDGPATLRMQKQLRWFDSSSKERKMEERALAGAKRDDLSTALVATGLAYDAEVRAAQGEVLARLVPRVRDIRRFGSAALDLAWTAAGRYDAYFERSVKPWDIAAGTLICRGAGLEVVELPEREDLPWGILVAPPALCAPLLELISAGGGI
jgi:myo-inositol-1(or 4)-monophosphatase